MQRYGFSAEDSIGETSDFVSAVLRRILSDANRGEKIYLETIS